jgi:hypothetical protein
LRTLLAIPCPIRPTPIRPIAGFIGLLLHPIRDQLRPKYHLAAVRCETRVLLSVFLGREKPRRAPVKKAKPSPTPAKPTGAKPAKAQGSAVQDGASTAFAGATRNDLSLTWLALHPGNTGRSYATRTGLNAGGNWRYQ